MQTWIWIPVQFKSCGSAGKESACNAGELGSIPGMGRSPGEGKGYPLQYSGLENSMDCIVHGVYSPWGGKELDTTEQLSLSFQKTHAPKVHCSTIYNSQDMEGITFLFGVKQISLQCELLCSASSCFSSLQHSNFLSVASLEGRLSVLLCLTS